MESGLRDTFGITSLMVQVSLQERMDLSTEGSLKTVDHTVEARRSTPMDLYLKVILLMERRGTERSSGRTAHPTLENSRVTLCTVRVDTNGLMVEDTKDNGSITKCTETVYSSSRMVEHTKASTKMIKRMVKESTPGQMEGSMKANSTKVSNTELVLSLWLMEKLE